MRDIRVEYQRFNSHPLRTVTKAVVDFMNISPEQSPRTVLFFVGLNVQSVCAHRMDLETDFVLTTTDFFMLSETWMSEKEDPAEIAGYCLVSQSHKATAMNVTESDQPQQQQMEVDQAVVKSSKQIPGASSDDTVPLIVVPSKRSSRRPRRVAGGVEIYKRADIPVPCIPYVVPCEDIKRINATIEPGTGDLTVVEIMVGAMRMVAACIYLHPGADVGHIKLLMLLNLGVFGRSLNTIIPELPTDLKTPMLITGDFNIDPDKPTNEWLVKYMDDEYDLGRCPVARTTLGNTSIDLTFARNLSPELMSLVTYYSYHKQIVHRLSMAD